MYLHYVPHIYNKVKIYIDIIWKLRNIMIKNKILDLQLHINFNLLLNYWFYIVVFIVVIKEQSCRIFEIFVKYLTKQSRVITLTSKLRKVKELLEKNIKKLKLIFYIIIIV